MDNSILVIDDEKDFLESLARGLTISGYNNLCLVLDPLEASRLIESGEAREIALIDITMPGMSSIELLEYIKLCNPATQCIMVTAIDEIETAEDCMKKGACDYLVKPVSRKDLVRKIQRALEKRGHIENNASGN